MSKPRLVHHIRFEPGDVDDYDIGILKLVKHGVQDLARLGDRVSSYEMEARRRCRRLDRGGNCICLGCVTCEFTPDGLYEESARHPVRT